MTIRKEQQNNIFVGERLRVARTAKGLTLAEVADKIGKTRQYVSQVETQVLHPTDEMISLIARTLEVNEVFFSKPIVKTIDASEVHFRHRLTTPDSKKKEVLSKLLVLQELLDSLESLFNLPEAKFPHFQCSTNEDIERAAEKTRLHLGISLKKPIGNFARLIENSGGIVTTLAGHDHRLDALSINRTRPIFVILDKAIAQSPARERFDLGHELGHIVMHSGLETGNKKLEGEANRFASAFLMPRSSFVNEFPDKITRFDWVKMYDVKLRWGVSIAAIIRRLYDLKLIDSTQYRWGHIYLSKSGQRYQEKYDDRLIFEVPEMINKCWNALRRHPQKLMELQKQLAVTPHFLESVFSVGLEFKDTRAND